MAYTPQQWHDDTTDSPYGPISGDRLNYIEAGIQAAAAAADAAGTASGGASLGTALPVIDGAAAAGTSGSAAHEDHVHPTDTSRAALASPTFTGHPVGVTEAALNNSTRLATTAYADTAVGVETTRASTAEALKANLAGPTFTGTVTLPSTTVAVTASASDNSTKPATTAYVDTADALKANLASPTFSGTVTVPSVVAGSPTFSGTVTIGAMAGTPTLPSATIATTQTAADNSTKLATTAYVDAKERAFLFGKAGAIGATETNAADFPFIVPFAATMKRCKVVLGTAASGAMTVQIRKASAPGTAVPSYSDVTGFVATFASGSQIATFTLGTAVAVTEGDLLNFSAATGSGTNMMVEVVAT